MELEQIIDSAKEFVKENKYFCIGTALYALTAAADAYMTIHGLNSNVNLGEGNPIPRFFMELYDSNELGLIVHKSLVGFSLAIVCKYVKLKKSLKDGFLVNSPLYFVSMAQGMAAASWCLVS